MTPQFHFGVDNQKYWKQDFKSDICISMSVAVLFTIAKKWKKSSVHSQMNEFTKRGIYTRSMEYYSTLKRKEILKHTTTWINTLTTLFKVG